MPTWGSRRTGLLLLALSGGASVRAAEPVQLDQVEVTARNPERMRLEAPAAITAYDGNFLAANGIADLSTLAPLVPGFFVSAQSVENVSLSLRGLSTDTNDPREQPRVSVFQDGVVLSNSHGNSVALFDLEDVAVFKGPQPTAFGRGASGGTIALTSNRAINARSGSLTLGTGSRNTFDADLVVNRPIVPDQLFGRVAVSSHRRDGYVKNLADGSALQGENTLAVRTSLRWQPHAATTADLIFNFQHDDTPGVALKSMAGIPRLPPVADTDPFAPADLNRGAELGVTRTIAGVTGAVNQKLGDAWTLLATTGWRDVRSNHEFDSDGTRYYLLEIGERFHAGQLSQELRFNYAAPGPLSAQVGAAVLVTRDHQSTIIRSDENALWMFFTHLPPPAPFNPRYAEQTALGAAMTAIESFGRVDYAATKRLTLGAGLRLTRERLESHYQSFAAAPRGNLAGIFPTSGGANNFFRPTPGRLDHAIDVNAWSGQLDARYALAPQVDAFATVARGRRPPVLSDDLITLAPEVHAEESVCNYEAGVKGTSASRRVRYAASLFQYDFAHFQTQRVVGPGVLQPYDGGRARGRGLDATLQADATRAISMFATYGFTDAKFSARDAHGAPQLFAGDTFRLTSRHVVSLGGTISHALADGAAIFVTPRFAYRSGYFFEDNNAQNGGTLYQGGYGLLHLRVGYRARGGRWEIVAQADNLLGKRYLLDAGNLGGAYGLPTETPAAPRTIDAKVTVRF